MAGSPTVKFLDCVILVQALETYWAYYSQSEGSIYDAECKETARDFLVHLNDALDAEPSLEEQIDELITANKGLREIMVHLEAWIDGTTRRPFDTFSQSRFMLVALFSAVKDALIPRTGATVSPPTNWGFLVEEEFSSVQVRWRSHFPAEMLEKLPENPTEMLSQAPSIAIIGDIRRSQDLMTYSPDAQFFSRQMLDFLATTRRLLDAQGGIFDKFTGDGFLAYFNQAVSEALGRDMVTSFLTFCEAELEFAKGHFAAWSEHVRKLPPTPVGLTLGSDFGRIHFRDEGNVLFAVGDAIVWSDRMCSSGAAGDLVVNNILAAELRRRNVPLTPTEGKTKAGEPFIGYRAALPLASAVPPSLPPSRVTIDGAAAPSSEDAPAAPRKTKLGRRDSS